MSGIGIAVLTISFGLGFGLSNQNTEKTKKTKINKYYDPVNQIARTETDLLTSGIDFNNKNYNVIKENNKLLVIVPSETTLLLSPPELQDNNFARNKKMGGLNPPAFEVTYDETTEPRVIKTIEFYGQDYFYTFPYAGIGHVKIVNDGYIWGGYQYNTESNEIELHETLQENGPLQFGTISNDGLVLIDLAIVNYYLFKLEDYNKAIANNDENQKNMFANQIITVDKPETESARNNVGVAWPIFNYENKARVGTSINPETPTRVRIYPHRLLQQGRNPVPIFPDGLYDETNKPSVDENGKYSISELSCGIDIKGFKVRELVDDDGHEICIIPNNVDNENKALVNEAVSISLGNFNYSLSEYVPGLIQNPFFNDVVVSPDGKILISNENKEIKVPKQQYSLKLPSDVKIPLREITN